MTGSANVTANNVTFLLSGANSNIDIQSSGTMTLTPYTDAAAGQWAGFVFFYDLPSSKKNSSGKSKISKSNDQHVRHSLFCGPAAENEPMVR